MRKIVSKPIPNAVGTAEIKDPELKRVTMLMMENIRSLHGQIKELQDAARELQRR